MAGVDAVAAPVAVVGVLVPRLNAGTDAARAPAAGDVPGGAAGVLAPNEKAAAVVEAVAASGAVSLSLPLVAEGFSFGRDGVSFFSAGADVVAAAPKLKLPAVPAAVAVAAVAVAAVAPAVAGEAPRLKEGIEANAAPPWLRLVDASAAVD